MDATSSGAHMLVEATGESRIVMPQIENALEHGAKVIIIGMTAGAAPVDLVKYQIT